MCWQAQGGRSAGRPHRHCSTVPIPPRLQDYAFLAERLPAAFVMLGIRNESAGSVWGLHTPQFRLDEAALPIGAALHVQFALDFLAGSGGDSGGGGALREEL